ncbi:MAG: DMT family transporter [bacterium]|nr:DMT family transporter [bacterium]
MKLYSTNISPTKANLWLFLTTAIWGLTFPVIKSSLALVPAGLFLGLRMSFTALILWVVLKLLKIPIYYPFHKHGIGLILSFSAGFLLQTFGLEYTTASKSGFLTSLYVIFVPFLSERIAREKPKLISLLAIPLAVLGTGFMMSPKLGGDWNIGDFLTIGCAVAFAFQIVWTSRIGKEVHPLVMLLVPAFFTGLFAFLLLPIQLSHVEKIQMGQELFWGLGYTVFFGSIVALYVMNRFQPYTDAVTASLIYTLEPVYAAFFAVLFFNEMISMSVFIGGLLVLAANVIIQFPFQKWFRNPM